MKDNFFAGVVIALIYLVLFFVVKSQADYMQRYAIEHNCRWDYNDMCYTEEERPYLFK